MKKKPTKRKKPTKVVRRKTARKVARKRKSNPRKSVRKVARKTARKAVRKTARKTARKLVRRPAGRKRNTTKRRKNARPSLLRLILPVEEMKALAEGAAGDLKSLAPKGNSKRNGRRLRRVRSAVPVRSGKGSRKNPYVHAVRSAGGGKRKGRRRNGEQEQAENLYATFHGRNSAETLTFADEVRSREWLGGLGKLVELRYLTPTNFEAATAFEGDRAPQLAASGDGRSLYLVGGDQSIDLAAVEMDGPEWRKDLMLIGVLFELTYQTEKEFHSFQLIDYYHELGEETDVCPMLVYDTLNRRLLIVGGQYQVRPEGITN